MPRWFADRHFHYDAGGWYGGGAEAELFRPVVSDLLLLSGVAFAVS